MACAAHPSIEAVSTCAGCGCAMCSACVAYDVDDRASCAACGLLAEDRSRSLGTTVLALVGLGYLATLAVSVAVFHGHPFVGGIAAVSAIALGRGLQLVLKPPVVARRLKRS